MWCKELFVRCLSGDVEFVSGRFLSKKYLNSPTICTCIPLLYPVSFVMSDSISSQNSSVMKSLRLSLVVVLFPLFFGYILKAQEGEATKPVVSLMLGTSFYQSPDRLSILGEQVESSFWVNMENDPSKYDQIMEALQGDFFLGTPEGETLTEVVMDGERKWSPNLGLGLSISRRLEVSVNLQRFEIDHSGQFPITVFPNSGTGETQQIFGSVQSTSKGLFADLGLRYLLPGKIRPYAETGLRRQWTSSYESELTIGNTTLPMAMPEPEAELNIYTGLGVRWYVRDGLHLQSGITYSHWPGSPSGIGANLSVGYTFGNTTKGNPPILASVSNSSCECGKATFSLAVTSKPRNHGIRETPPVSRTYNYDSSITTRHRFPENTAVKTDTISLSLSDLAAICTECKYGPCTPDDIVVSMKSDDLGVSSYEEIQADDGTYSLKKVLTSRDSDGDAEVFIKVRYTCVGSDNDCSDRSCSYIFSVIFPRST